MPWNLKSPGLPSQPSRRGRVKTKKKEQRQGWRAFGLSLWSPLFSSLQERAEVTFLAFREIQITVGYFRHFLLSDSKTYLSCQPSWRGRWSMCGEAHLSLTSSLPQAPSSSSFLVHQKVFFMDETSSTSVGIIIIKKNLIKFTAAVKTLSECLVKWHHLEKDWRDKKFRKCCPS